MVNFAIEDWGTASILTDLESRGRCRQLKSLRFAELSHLLLCDGDTKSDLYRYNWLLPNRCHGFVEHANVQRDELAKRKFEQSRTKTEEEQASSST